MINSDFFYCDPAGIFVGGFNVTHVKFNTIDHTPDHNDIHSYFDRIKTDLKPGSTYSVSLRVNREDGIVDDQNRVSMWADWNYNSRYDRHELLLSEVVSAEDYDEEGNHVITGEIKVPLNAVQAKVGLRVMGHLLQGTESNNSCDYIIDGNALDYGLNILKTDDHPLIIDFSGSPTEIKTNESVFFSDLSVAATGDKVLSHKWKFQGGVPPTSNEQYPVIRYPDIGSHDVTLTIKTVSEYSETKTIRNMVRTFHKYCEVPVSFGTYFNVTNVRLNTIDHAPRLNSFYSYYDEISTDLMRGETHPISLTVSKGNSSEADVNRVRVWADWNYNGHFDNHELLLSEVVNAEDYDEEGNHVINGEIKVPLNAVQAKVGLRVMGHFMQDTEGDQPCDVIESGNAADYALNIISTLTIANAIAYRRVTSNFSPITLDLAPVFIDANEDALTYTAVSSNTDVVTVVINSSDLVITYAGLGTSTITVTATDINGETVDDAFDITVIAVPVITSPATASVEEGTTEITKVTATDADSDDLIYSISGGADRALFSINRTSGALTFQTAPNFENPADQDSNNRYEVAITVNDGTNSDTQTITVTVTDVNDNSPMITSSATLSATEGTTEVLTVTATDADAGTILNYSISGGADRALFRINRTSGALAFQTAPDFENPND